MEKARSHARRSGKSQPTAAWLALLQSCNLSGWALACAGTTQGVVLAATQLSLYQLIQIWEAQPATLGAKPGCTVLLRSPAAAVLEDD